MNNDASLENPQHNRHAVTDLADARAHLINIIQQSRRYLHILSENLHPNLYDDDSICAALSAFVRQNPNSHLRILIHEPVYLIRHHHKIMPLIRRLPSKISIRQIIAPAGDFPFFLSGDLDKSLLFSQEDQGNGHCNLQCRVTAQQLQAHFEEAWRQAVNIADLQTLSL